MRLFLKGSLLEEADIEITKVNFAAVSKAMFGEGILIGTKRDINLENYPEYSGYTWSRVEVKTDDLATVLWEGYIPIFGADVETIFITGFEGLKVLDRAWAHHSSILAMGKITALGSDDGGSGPYLDDTEAAFVEADLLNKFALFTDTDDPDTEEMYPNSNSALFHGVGADDPADYEYGTWESLVPSGTFDGMAIGDRSTVVADGYGVDMYFTVTERLTSTKLEIHLQLNCGRERAYTIAGEHPCIWVYDYDGAAWVNSSGDMTGEGRVTGWGAYQNETRHTVVITGNITNYIDAGTLQVGIRVTCGDATANAPAHVSINKQRIWVRAAKLVNTYSALFSVKATLYQIDGVPSANRLTFAGQDPSLEGAEVGDLYRIGDTIDDVMTDLFTASENRIMDVECEATVKVDISDYWYSYLGPTLRDLAQEMNRKVWQRIGWHIRCYETYTATGYTITEDNMVTNIDGKGWKLVNDGTYVVNKVLVYGANNQAIVRGTGGYSSEYALIMSDPTITTATQAQNKAQVTSDEQNAPRLTLACSVDCGAADWSDLDVGKTIAVNLYSGKCSFTGLILEIHYRQFAGENLKADLLLEET